MKALKIIDIFFSFNKNSHKICISQIYYVYLRCSMKRLINITH